MESIKHLIKNKGFATISEFIFETMFNPFYGYYCKRNPIGEKSDFITSSEITPIFGELIAAYFFNLILNSKSQKISFVEMGAGNGTMFCDILRTFEFLSQKTNFDLFSKVNFSIIEISDLMTLQQQKNIPQKFSKISWHKSFADFIKHNQDSEIYFVSNELFDCLATHQFAKTNSGWQEIVVTLNQEELLFGLENFNKLKSDVIQDLADKYCDSKNFKDGDIFEHSFATINLMQEIASAIENQGGMALIIDYGYIKSPLKSTLQAIKNHKKCDILQNACESDLTTLVNFFALEKSIKNKKIDFFLTSQREFLFSLGIEEKIKRSAVKNKELALVERLINSSEMGDLFKCFGVWKKN